MSMCTHPESQPPAHPPTHAQLTLPHCAIPPSAQLALCPTMLLTRIPDPPALAISTPCSSTRYVQPFSPPSVFLTFLPLRYSRQVYNHHRIVLKYHTDAGYFEGARIVGFEASSRRRNEEARGECMFTKWRDGPFDPAQEAATVGPSPQLSAFLPCLSCFR